MTPLTTPARSSHQEFGEEFENSSLADPIDVYPLLFGNLFACGGPGMQSDRLQNHQELGYCFGDLLQTHQVGISLVSRS